MEEKEPYIVDGKNTRPIHTSVALYAGQSAKLQALAKKFGFLQTRGVGAGKVGSISQLIRAIANGEIELNKSTN